MAFISDLLGVHLFKIVTLAFFGTKYRFPLWEFCLIFGVSAFFVSFIITRGMSGHLVSKLGLSFPYFVFLAPIIEEIVFRVILISALFILTGSLVLSIFASAILFGVLHIGWGGYRVLDTILGGLTLGFIFVNFGLVPALIVHITHNFLTFLTGRA